MTNSPEGKFQSGEFITALKQALSEIGATALPDDALKKLADHYEMVARWNSRLNLTRIVKPNEAARLHYAESIFGGRFIGKAKKLLDVGSGAGFPAVPLAVANPHLEVTALESNQKKSVFLKEVKDALKLANFDVIANRLEDFDWSSYEVVTSRALDRASDIYPAMLGALRPGSTLMLYCGGEMVTELAGQLAAGVQTETHPIPGTKGRLIALFRAAAQPQVAVG